MCANKITATPICEFIKSFLGDFRSMRNINDKSNCICAACSKCLQQIYGYDGIKQKVAEKETKLYNLLLATEVKLGMNNGPVEIRNEIWMNGFEISTFDLNTGATDSYECHSKTLAPFIPPQPSTSSSMPNTYRKRSSPVANTPKSQSKKTKVMEMEYPKPAFAVRFVMCRGNLKFCMRAFSLFQNGINRLEKCHSTYSINKKVL